MADDGHRDRDPGVDLPPGRGLRAALPAARDLLAAFGLLTGLPASRPSERSDLFARATLFFPIVGLCIGAVLLGLDLLLEPRLPRWLASIVLVACWEALSATETLRGWGSCVGGLAAGERRRTGLAGVAAMAAVFAAKTAAVHATSAARAAALLFAPVLARWGMVVLAVGARHRDAPGQKFAPAVTFREFALTSAFTLAAVFAVTEAFGILVVICVASATLGLRLLLHRRAGGVSWQWLLAGAQMIETLVIALFALT